ncbi:MAG: 16S rRNA (cytidine(1402)-2'-O)-methyltransferase [Candidatus Omnitrophica bacterium]|nr:16S rRNA (cytidine(1402)-2'-O)-methyltransferase [Candidatus Omnitrophota bacterium]MCK5393489.1 16S rRNA (cytidine(1402)-2'-O)-methyltransferase [Candidatus Omnitrophota bacterium]
MLFIVATPIGNMEDISLRALRILKEVDFILAEDTRKTGMLLKRLDIKKKMVSFFDHNEGKRIAWVIEELKRGKTIALVSSAGTPTIADPGFKLVRECRRENVEVTSIPGPSSVINALVLTSVPHDKFLFLGYLSRKKSDRIKCFQKLKEINITGVFLESPYRVLRSLNDLKEVLGDRKIAVIREMTKKFEEVLEVSLGEAISNLNKKLLKGEIIVVVERLS